MEDMLKPSLLSRVVKSSMKIRIHMLLHTMMLMVISTMDMPTDAPTVSQYINQSQSQSIIQSQSQSIVQSQCIMSLNQCTMSQNQSIVSLLVPVEAMRSSIIILSPMVKFLMVTSGIKSVPSTNGTQSGTKLSTRKEFKPKQS